MRKFKAVISIFLAFSLLFCLGCSSTYNQNITVSYNTQKENGNNYIFDYDENGQINYTTKEELEAQLGYNNPSKNYYAPKWTYNFLGEDVMPIVGYIEPKISDENFLVETETAMREFAESGCNVMNCVNYYMHEDYVKVMTEFAEQYGFMMLVKYSALGNLSSLDRETAVQQLKEDLDWYLQKKSFGGLHVADEPGYLSWTGTDQTYNISIDYFKEVCNSRLFFINLLPIYSPAWAFPNGATNPNGVEKSTDYDYYYQTYMEKVRPQVVSYDYYPLTGAYPGLKNEHFKQLTIIKKLCEQAKVPFWSFSQITDWSASRPVTYSEIAWQNNTALVFGAKGVQYYTYNYATDHNSTAVDEQGNKTQTYYNIQKVNKHIAGVDELLMNCNVKAIIQSGVTPNGEKLSSELNLVNNYGYISSSQGVPHLIGCMDYYPENEVDLFNDQPQVQQVYYVCNNTTTKDGDVTLYFTKEVEFEVRYNGVVYVQSGHNLTVSLNAGEACSVRILGEL